MKSIESEIFIFIFGGLFLLLGIFMVKNSFTQLDHLNKYSGTVIDNGITKDTTEGLNQSASEVFYLKLTGLHETLSIYKVSGNYADLLSNIQNGDYLTVYFESHKNRKRLNLDLFQIEKNNEIIWGLKDSTPRYLGLGIFIIIIVSFPLIGFGIVLDKKRRKENVHTGIKIKKIKINWIQ